MIFCSLKSKIDTLKFINSAQPTTVRQKHVKYLYTETSGVVYGVKEVSYFKVWRIEELKKTNLLSPC